MNTGKQHLDNLYEALENLEADLNEREESFGKQARGKELLIRLLIMVTVIIALINVYFVNDLTEEVRSMTRAMNEMNSHFDSVSGRMTNITNTVTSMNETVHMLPIVAAQMNDMAAYSDSMRQDMQRIRESSNGVEQRIQKLDADVLDMAHRFRRLNVSVGRMSIDVDHMSRPVP